MRYPPPPIISLTCKQKMGKQSGAGCVTLCCYGSASTKSKVTKQFENRNKSCGKVGTGGTVGIYYDTIRTVGMYCSYL